MSDIHLVDVWDKTNPMDLKAQTLGLGYLAAYAEKIGGYSGIRIYKSSEDISFDRMPRVVGISSVTQNFMIAKKLIRNIRAMSKDVIIILGGTHASLLPLSSPQDVDYIVVGEGEITFTELLDHIFKGKGKVQGIKGIYYKKDGRFTCTGKREQIKDLDILPFPRRDGTNITVGGEAHILASRGCPFKCPFCASARFWETVRFHSAAYVIRELAEIISTYHVKTISIADDLFITSKPRVRELAREIIRRGWHKSIAFQVQVRANLVDEEVVTLLKSINVTNVGMGIESGSEKILKIIKGGSVTVAQNYRAVQLFKQAGIKMNGYFIMGYPGETLEDIEKTWEFIRKAQPDMGQTYLAIPYPGTELWDICRRRGIVSDNMDWGTLHTEIEDERRGIVLASDLPREVVWREFMRFREYWLGKHIENSGSLLNYVRRLNYAHFWALVREPKKNGYVIKAVLGRLKGAVTPKVAVR